MPRAPSCSASMMSESPACAVSSSVRTGGVNADSSRSAASPGVTGMSRSSKRMSGRRSVASLMASRPLPASPTTRTAGSVSSSLRSASRNSGWSSAMTTVIEERVGVFISVYVRDDPKIHPVTSARSASFSPAQADSGPHTEITSSWFGLEESSIDELDPFRQVQTDAFHVLLRSSPTLLSIFVRSSTFFMRHRRSWELLFTWSRSALCVRDRTCLAIRRVLFRFSTTSLWHINCSVQRREAPVSFSLAGTSADSV